MINGDGKICGLWVRVTFIFGYTIITGRPLGCLVNDLGAGVVKHLPRKVAGVRGKPWQEISPSGRLALETTEWQPLAGAQKWKAIS